jgi:D-serine deaminase-like pyridoxal phosphate-dependent protein
LPAALVELDAFEANVDAIAGLVATRGRRLRIATKSIRAPALVERILARGGDRFQGLMTYTAAETEFWAARGQRDLLLAYPTMQPADLTHLVTAQRAGAVAAVVVDDEAHVAALAAAARAGGVVLPAVIEVDLSYRPVGARVHIGVRRSPLRAAADVVALAERIAGDPALRFHGVMGYEAQIAGVGDREVGWKGWPTRLLKRRSCADVAATRAQLVGALRARGLVPVIFNGGGTGSLPSAREEDALTELTAGSGFLCSHLFDHYADVRLAPAAYFALQVVRRPAADLVTCHGGGYVASGAAGPDRLPVPALPVGLSLLAMEGAGEVQTPLRVPRDVALAAGDPVLFRHAKAGELAEHFSEYLLVRGDRVEDRATTYRGLGQCFLG